MKMQKDTRSLNPPNKFTPAKEPLLHLLRFIYLCRSDKKKRTVGFIVSFSAYCY